MTERADLPVYRDFHFRCMVMPEGYQDAELTQLLADLMNSYKDLPLAQRAACLRWALAHHESEILK